MKDYEIDIKEIKEILKKMQEDINRLENNFLYYSVNEYGPAVNNLPSTQACSEEEILRQYKVNQCRIEGAIAFDCYKFAEHRAKLAESARKRWARELSNK